MDQKTLTLFKGTHTRCYNASSLHEKLSRVSGYVVNDVVCWEKLDAEEFYEKKKRIPEEENLFSMEEFLCTLRHFNLRLLLYQQNTE